MKTTIHKAMSSLTAKLAALLLAFTCAGTAWGATTQVSTLAELTDAITAASAGDTIQLTADITVSGQTITFDKALTLDLNEKTLTLKYASFKQSYLKNTAPLTVVGGTIASSCSLVNDYGIWSESDLTLDGVTITANSTNTSSSTDGNVYAVYQVNGTLTIKDSSLKATANAIKSGIEKNYAYAVYVANPCEGVSISGSTLSVDTTGRSKTTYDTSCGLYLAADVIPALSQNTISGIVVANTNTKDMTIGDGNVINGDLHGISHSGTGTVTVDGITVNSGTAANNSYGVSNEGTGTIVITGNASITGKFAGACNSKGGTIIIESGTVTATYANTGSGIRNDGPGSVVIDGGAISGQYGIFNSGAGTITVNDGEITGTNAGANSGAVVNYSTATGTIDIKGGTVNAAGNAVNSIKGTVAVSGGTVNGTIKKATNGTVTVSGGTFTTDVSSYLAADSTQTDNGNGTYTIASPVAQVGETKYNSLMEAIDAAYNGGTVELLEDVTVEYWHQNIWTLKDGQATYPEGLLRSPVEGCNGLTINGNGHSLTINSVDSGSNGNHIFSRSRNLTISNITINAASGVNGIGLKSGLISDVTFNMAGSDPAIYTSGSAGCEEGEHIEIRNCTFNTEAADSYAIYSCDPGNGVDVGTVISGNTFNTRRSVALRSDMQFLDNTVNGAKGVTVAGGSTAVVSGNYFSDTTTSRSIDVYPSNATIENNVILGPIELENETYETAPDLSGNYWGGDAPANLPEGVVVDSYYTTYNGYDSPAQDGSLFALSDTVVVVAQVISAEGTMTVYDDLHAALEAGKAAGSVVTLLADVNLAGVAWVPVGTAADKFHGAIDGNGKVISNLTVNDPTLDYAGLIGYGDGNQTNPYLIKDLTISNATITARSYAGALAGHIYAGYTVSNVTVKGLVQVTANYMVGGMVGKGYLRFRDCSIAGDEGSFVKGLYLGQKNETVGGVVLNDDYEGDNVGGMVGHLSEGSTLGCYNCSVSGLTILGSRKVGGIAGTTGPENHYENVDVRDITIGTTATAEYATAKKSSMEIGGIVGSYYDSGTGGVLSGTVQDVAIAELPTGVTGTGDSKNISYGLVSGGHRSNNPENYGITYTHLITKGYDAAIYNNDYFINNYKAKVTDANGDFVGYYDSIAAAVAASSTGYTITLVDDVDEDVTLASWKNNALTIDLGGYTLTGQIIAPYGAKSEGIVIKNGSIVGRDSSRFYCLQFGYGSGNATLENLSVTQVSQNSRSYAIFFQQTSKSVTLRNVTLDGRFYTANSGSTIAIESGVYKNSTGLSNSDISNEGVVAAKGGTFYYNPTTPDNLVAQSYVATETTDANDVQCWVIERGPSLATVKLANGTETEYWDIQEAFAAIEAGCTLTIKPGEYTLSAGSGTAGAYNLPANVTIVGAGENVNGVRISSLNQSDPKGLILSGSGITVSNLYFKAEKNEGSALVIRGSGTVVDCVLDGMNETYHCVSDGMYQGDVNGTVHFLRSSILAERYAINFGGTSGEVIIEDCTVKGWSSFGSGVKVTVLNTTFAEGTVTDDYTTPYNFIRFYDDAFVSNSTFNAQMGVDVCYEAKTGISLIMSDCTYQGEGSLSSIVTETDKGSSGGVSSHEIDNNYVAIGTNVQLDENGDIVGGLFEVVDDELIATGYLSVDNLESATAERYPLTVGGPFVAVIVDDNGKFVNGYTTLQAAFDEAETSGKKTEIVLVDDAVVAGTDNEFYVAYNRVADVVLDLNGHNVINTCTDGAYGQQHAIVNEGTLTIKDSQDDGTKGGCVYTMTVAQRGNHVIANSGTLTIEGGWFGDSDNDKTNANDLSVGHAVYNTGTAVINGGHFTAVDNNFTASPSRYAYVLCSDQEGATMAINDADVYGAMNGVISATSGGDVTINGGNFYLGRANATTYVYRLIYTTGTSVVEVNGGNWTANNSQKTGEEDFKGFGSSQILLKGGTFTLQNGFPYASEGACGVVVSGGNYSKVVPSYCAAAGYIPTTTPDENGKYTVTPDPAKVVRNATKNVAYATWADGFAALEAGETLQCLTNFTGLGAITLPAGATLDGNGFTLSGTSYLAVNAAGGTVKNVNFNAIGARNATTPAITANDLAGALVVEGCTFANGVTGYKAETDVVVTTVADASVKIIGNTFTGKTEKNYVIVEGAAAYAAEITGNVFNAGAKTRAFAVVNGGENVEASGNYVADGLYFGVSTNGVNGSELAYPQLASPSAATAEKTLPLFIVKNSPDGYPAIKGYAALPDAFVGASSGETILMTADATLDAAAVAASKSLVLDGQGFTLTASSDWSMKGAKAAGQNSATNGFITLQKITLKYDAASDYSAARLGGNVTLGENVVIDASAVTTPNAVLATGIAVAADATPKVKAGTAVQAGDTLIFSLTLGDGASVEVSGLPTGLYDAIADNALALRTQEAKVTVGETVTYYNTLQEALAAAVTATSEPLVEALVDEIDCSGWTSCVFNSASKLITFEGNGVTLTNLDAPLVNKSGSGAKGIVVKNVTVKDANIQTTDNYAAVFLPYADCVGTIYFENCHIVDSTVTGNKQLGGFVGFNSGYNNLSDGPLFNNVTITNCSVTGSTFTSNEGSVGALVGHAAANPWSKVGIFDTVVSNNTISCNENIKAGSVIGTIGCAGEENNGKTGGVTVSADVGGNTVSANGVATDRIFGRIGSTGGAVAVTGGTYDGSATYANDSYDSNNGKIIVSGGTFQTQPSQDAIADGYVAELSQDVNGWWTVGGPFVAKIGNVGYATLEEAFGAAVDGDTVELLADAEIASTITKDAAISFTIDGAGYTVSPATGFSGTSAFMLGNTSSTALGAPNYTITNTVFSGFSTSHGVLRCQGSTVTVTGCTFTGNTATGDWGIINSNYAAVTVDGCVFENNVAANSIIDVGNMMGDDGTATGPETVVRNSLFTGNTGSTALVNVGIGGGKTTLESNTFSQNTGGIAVVYAANSIDIQGNLFDRNTVTVSNAKGNTVTVLVGPYSYTGERTVNVKDNAFVDNVNAYNNSINVYLEDYSSSGTTTSYNIGGNYWGDGEAPVAGTDYIAQRTAVVDTYATAYAANAEGYGVGVTESAAAIAQIVRNDAVVGYYWTLASAIAAAQEGDTVEILAAEISEGSVTFPATLKNVTIKAADGVEATLKDMTLNSATGSAVDYEGITIDGLVFDNSRLLFTGSRTGEVVYKDWAIVNCTFTNIVASGNYAAVQFGTFTVNKESMNGFTFTNNVIDGVSGSNNSGLNINRLSGETLIEANIIKNVAWNAFQLLNGAEGSTITITNNYFASAGDGVVNLAGNNADITFVENAVVNTGSGKGVEWIVDGVDVTGNYWGGGEPSVANGKPVSYSYYTTYAETTDWFTLSNPVGALALVKDGDTLKGGYYTVADAIANVDDGQTILLQRDSNVVTGYGKQIGDSGYGEGAGANRLVIDNGKTFTFDLGGNTLSGRINFTHGNMTLTNGTVKASGQALNIYGTKDYAYAGQNYSVITIGADVTVEAGYGLCVFGGDPNSGYYPLGFGEVFNVYGKVHANSPVYVSGNVGMDAYAANTGVLSDVEALKETTGKKVSELMALYGPAINIYEGAELIATPSSSVSDNSQGISLSGCAIVNVTGGTITGAEGVGMKGGVLNVSGGTIKGTGAKCDPVQAVSSGTESSGAAISASTFYNAYYPIVINVTGGTIESANNAALLVAHSVRNGTPINAVNGVTATISGGTFIGGANEEAVIIEDAREGEEGLYPENFVSGGLFTTPVPEEYCAVNYVPAVYDETQGLYTVKTGHYVAEVTYEDGEGNEVVEKFEMDEDTTEAEALAAAAARADELGDTDSTITVIVPTTGLAVPAGWTFVTDEATPPVTTLQRTVAQNITVNGETVTTNATYATIQAAIDDAQDGDTVEVVRNVTLAEGLEITQSITLTGAVNDDGTPRYTVTGPADLTSASSPVAGDIFVADDYGAVVVTISNLKLDGFGKDVASDGFAAVVSFYAYEEGSALTVENVEFSNYSAFAVATAGADGLLTVKDCAMEGEGGVLAEGADAKVVGGTMTGVAEGVVAESGASVEIDGLEVSVATDGNSVVVDAQSKATIVDGVFAGKMLAGGLDVSQQGKGADLSISGGVFENYVYEEYCAVGNVAVDYAGDVAAYAGWYQVVPGSYVASVTHEGAVKYYASLESALAAAVDGDTIALCSDVSDPYTLADGTTLTLAKNGYSLTVVTDGANVVLETTEGELTTYSVAAADFSMTVGGTTTYYATLADAVDAAPTDGTAATIKPLNAVAVAGFTTRNGQNITIDMNGKRVNLSTPATVVAGSTVALSGSGMLGIAGNDATAALIDNSGTLNLNGAQVLGKVTTKDGGTANVTGGTLYMTLVGEEGATVNVSGSPRFNAGYGQVTAKSGSTFTFAGGSIRNDLVVETGASVSISGGTFKTPVETAWCADGYVPTKSSSTYDPYSVAKAADAWAKLVKPDGGEFYYTRYMVGTALNTYSEDGDTLVLLVDYSSTGLNINNTGKKLTVDLNGFSARSVTFWYGDVTITNGTIVQDIDLYAQTQNSGKVSNLTIANGCTVNDGIVLWPEDDGDTGTGYDANLVVAGTVNGGIFVHGTLHEGNSTITLKDGAVVTDATGQAISVNGYATLNVESGATVTGATGIEMRAGVLNVTGGTITETAVGLTVTPTDSGSTVVGAAVAISQHATELPVTVNISGGTLNANAGGVALFETDTVASATPSANVAAMVTGGTFYGAVTNDNGVITIPAMVGEDANPARFSEEFKTQGVPPDYKLVAVDGTDPVMYMVAAKDYKVLVISDNGATTNKCETLAEAFGAANAGDAVMLLDDIVMGEHAYADKAVSIDGAGHSVTFVKDDLTPHSYNDFPIWIETATGADVIVTNVTFNGNGGNYTFGIEQANSVFDGVTVNANGNIGLCIQSGTATLTNVVIRNSGTSASGADSFKNASLTLAENADVTVNGGEYTSENGYAIYLLTTGGKFTINGGTFVGKIRAGVNNSSITSEILIKGGKFNVPEFKTDGATAKITISGGVFTAAPNAAFLAENYIVVDNEDAATKADYPYTVVETLVGDSFTYPIEGTSGVAVTKEWLAANVSDVYGSDETAPIPTTITNALVQALSANGANGMPVWQSYVLGQDPSDPNATLRLAAAPVAGDATKVTITGVIDLTNKPTVEGTTVTFRLASRNADGTWTDVEGCTGAATPSFDVSLDTVAGKVLAVFADIVTE